MRLAKAGRLCDKPPFEFRGVRRSPGRVEERGRSSVVEHNLAKVGVESSNLFARSKNFNKICVLGADKIGS